MYYLLVGLHNRLLDTYISVVWILPFKPQPAPVAKLIEGKRREPVGIFLAEHIAEASDRLRLIKRTCNISVGIHLRHHHRLRCSAVQMAEAIEALFCKLIYLTDRAPPELGAAPLGHLIGPAPVKGHILIHGPYIRLSDSLCELLLPDHFLAFGILYAADTKHCKHIWSLLLYYTRGTAVKVRHLLITCAAVEGEPVSRGLVIYPEEQPSEGPEIPAYGGKLFIGDRRIHCNGKGDVLTVAAYITHKAEGLAVCISA